MADIKLTLSSNPTMRSPSIEEEARWLEKEGALYYQLQAKPIRASDGCWVYFIRNSQLVAHAKARDFRWMAKEELGGSYLMLTDFCAVQATQSRSSSSSTG